MRRLQADVVVIGGGSTGAGVLRDCAMRGYRAILLDRADLGQGTSGRFHGLLHSGGRYVVSDPRSAAECARENEIVTRINADAVEATGGLFVVTPGDDPAFGDRFVAAAAAAGVWAREITPGQALAREPRLNPGIQRAFEVRDGSVDGWRLIWGAVDSARSHGAEALTYHEVTAVHHSDGQVTGVSATDLRSGESVEVECQFVLNCAGPWAGQITRLAGLRPVEVVPGRGIMIAMNHRLVNSVINRCVYPTDGDILVPAHTVCIIGTTDVHADDPDRLGIPRDEVQRMLDAGEALVPGFRQSRALHAWAGARPLIRDDRVSVDDTRHMSRGMAVVDHSVHDGVGGMLTIGGGKLTTYRLMAEHIVDAMEAQLGTPHPCRTADEPCPGTGRNHVVTDRLRQREVDRARSPIVCECELVSRDMVVDWLRRNPQGSFDDLRRQLRLGMGPCQGGFCAARLASIAVEEGRLDGAAAMAELRTFLEHRWIGLWPILYGEQAREIALDSWILQGSLDLRRVSNAEIHRSPVIPSEASCRRQDHVRSVGTVVAPLTDRTGSRVPRDDVVVIGAGLAGLTASIWLAEGGCSVTLLTFGLGGLPLGQGTVDVLGHGADGHLVERPFDELAHADRARAAIDWFASLVPGLLVPGDGRNHLVPTALGAMRPTYLVPPSMVWPDGASRVAVVGPRQIKDFSPALVAANLAKTAGVTASGHRVDLPARAGAECPPVVYAAALDDPRFLARFADAVRPELRDADVVVVAAVLGLKDLGVPARLAEALGRPVVEAIMPPPSVPGLRLNDALTRLATSLGVRLIVGSKVTGFSADGARVTSVTLHQAGRDQAYAADHFVYAPGGFESGALAVDSHGHVTETLFHLPLAVPDGNLIGPDVWAAQPLFAVGVSVDDEFRASYDNLYAVGGVLGGASWIDLSGDGAAIASAVGAADAILGVGHG